MARIDHAALTMGHSAWVRISCAKNKTNIAIKLNLI